MVSLPALNSTSDTSVLRSIRIHFCCRGFSINFSTMALAVAATTRSVTGCPDLSCACSVLRATVRAMSVTMAMGMRTRTRDASFAVSSSGFSRSLSSTLSKATRPLMLAVLPWYWTDTS